MTLIRRNQFLPGFSHMLSDLFSDLHHDTFVKSTVPAVNIKETAESFEVEVAAPGLKKEDFKIALEHNILSISAEKEERKEEKDEQGRYARQEFAYSSFKRHFTLPNSVDTERISAQYQDGILLVQVPKREESKQKLSRIINIS
mgnify:CR=1 FL=1